LGYVLKKRNPNVNVQSSKQEMPPGLEDALLAYGGKVVSALKTAPAQKRSLFELVDYTASRIDTLLPVVNYLMTRGYINRVVEDPKGNDTFQLTSVGQNIPA